VIFRTSVVIVSVS